jgi:hypothetical protein
MPFSLEKKRAHTICCHAAALFVSRAPIAHPTHTRTHQTDALEKNIRPQVQVVTETGEKKNKKKQKLAFLGFASK